MNTTGIVTMSMREFSRLYDLSRMSVAASAPRRAKARQPAASLAANTAAAVQCFRQAGGQTGNRRQVEKAFMRNIYRPPPRHYVCACPVDGHLH